MKDFDFCKPDTTEVPRIFGMTASPVAGKAGGLALGMAEPSRLAGEWEEVIVILSIFMAGISVVVATLLNFFMPAPINVCKPAEGADNFLKPVTPCEVSEGLPCAPKDWPNPGDNWGWRVGKRISNVGYYSDRFLYLPKRIQRAGAPRHFASKLSLERFLKSEFPGADIEDFLPHSVGRSHHHWHIQQMYFPLREQLQQQYCDKVHPEPYNYSHINVSVKNVLSNLDVCHMAVMQIHRRATLSKGFYCGLGTLSAGGLALGMAELSQLAGEWEVVIVLSIFFLDAVQVLKELDEAIKAYPNAFVRIIGFDNAQQVQCTSFIAYKPPGF
ncbi:hypothetical protein EZV62_024005 [Acer yangbiense]|uniref:Ribulose bisphosphate carboxylase small subunit domain-containing protein n=1 Tax=Acer yangbiense TaxID=1000413 RepID=A0A5C7H3J2_9ROSI|nr:hypothetical protein EZV62_024005 [Acer yangbiense]